MRCAARAPLCATLLLMAFGATQAADLKSPPGVIFDTDMYVDIDDMLALAMLHTLHDRGEIKLLAVTVGTEAKWVPSYIDLINTFYGHRDVPIGMVRGGITADTFTVKPFNQDRMPFAPNGIHFSQHLAQLAQKNGFLIYPHKLTDGAKAEEPIQLLRKTLAAQPDNSVVMVEVGYTTAFARLLDSKSDTASGLSGLDLVKRKVRFLSLMGASFTEVDFHGMKFPAGDARMEFNLAFDNPSAQKIFSEWPTPIVVSGAEVGFAMLFPQASVDRHFNYAVRHPIAETYNYVAPYYRKQNKDPLQPHDHPTFDLTSVLYAARPDEGYFSLSQPGKVSVSSEGATKFEAAEGGSHRYLILTNEQKARALEAMVMLVSQPPVSTIR